MKKIQYICKVVKNEKLCQKFYRLCLNAPGVAKQIEPGQFIHIRVSNGTIPLLRRPFSVHRAKKYVEILYEVVGPGTTILSNKKRNDKLDILGPLGNTFSLPPKGTTQAVMIAGGVGIAPFLILSDILKQRGYKPTLLYGGRTKGHVYKMDEFKKNGCRVHVSTDDGSVGTKGHVSKLFSKIELNSRKTALYACGPKPMMAAVQKFAKKHNLYCEASCEEVMACGLGTCLGCSIKTTNGYKTVCHDGPVFDIKKIIL